MCFTLQLDVRIEDRVPIWSSVWCSVCKPPASVVHFSNYFFDSSECSSVLGSSGCTNRWNLGLWRHLLVISFLLLIILPGSFTHRWNIASLSWLQRWHLGVPKVGTHATGLACHTFQMFMVLPINFGGWVGEVAQELCKVGCECV